MTAGSPARLLLGVRADGRPIGLDEHLAIHGPLPDPGRRADPEALVGLVERSGLRGRGGAGFPLARKLRHVAAGRGPAVVVANGSEGEPASAKDRVLLAHVPHLVLDGAAVAADALGARRVVVATHADTYDLLGAAIAERARRQQDRRPAVAELVPDRFVTGQETALVSFLSGGPGLPTTTPPRPAERGVDGRRTLVANVETLAHLALVARHGADWFRSVGTASEPGTTLVTLSGAVARPGVYEVDRGARLDDVLAGAGGPSEPLQALLLGGYAGTWLDAAAGTHARLDDAALSALGASLGAGVVLALPARDCGLAVTSVLLAYLAAESAGQCGPCVHGLAAMAGGMGDLAAGRGRRDVVERLEAWAWQVTGRGACAHPDGAARLADSALRVFAADVAAHRAGRPCPGAVGPSPRIAELPGLGSGRHR